MKVYGDIGTAGPWAALSYRLSVVQIMRKEFSWLRCEASLECPEPGHDDESIPISNKVNM